MTEQGEVDEKVSEPPENVLQHKGKAVFHITMRGERGGKVGRGR